MQKWEYAFAKFVDPDFIGIDYTHAKHETIEFQLGESPKMLMILLTKMGEDGWELIACKHASYYYFKRPIY
jgi:hypothetical protein